jgi:hypothetical protein
MVHILIKVSDIVNNGPPLSIRWYRYGNRANAFQGLKIQAGQAVFFATGTLEKAATVKIPVPGPAAMPGISSLHRFRICFLLPKKTGNRRCNPQS